MADELSALARNPYRYVTGGFCNHDTSTAEHLTTVFEVVLVMLLAWPAEDDGCPICRYFDCELLEEADDHLRCDCMATASA